MTMLNDVILLAFIISIVVPITYKLLYWFIVIILSMLNLGNIEIVRDLAKKDKMWNDVLNVLGSDKDDL